MLEIKNLFVGYGEKEIIKNISLKIEKGVFAGIIGPNGAGKTTLLKTVVGILKPKKGEILLEGKRISFFPFQHQFLLLQLFLLLYSKCQELSKKK